MLQQISIKGLLCRDDRALLLKTAGSGRWEFPGGRINFGENAEESFRREMKEELSFKEVKMGNLINMWSFTDIRKEIDRHFIVFDFEIFTDESKIILSDEHEEYRWIGKDEFESLEMREGHKETLRKYFGRKNKL